MLKVEELTDFRPVFKFTNGSDITLSTIQEALKDSARNMGVPIAFYLDQVKSGGMLNKVVEDCLVVHHPEHANDYYKFAIRIQRQGKMAFVNVNAFGSSKQFKKENLSAMGKEQRKGQSVGFKIGSAAVSGIMTLGKSKQKLEEERNYYSCIEDILEEVIS